MNLVAAPFMLPFRFIASYPWPSIIGSAVLAIFCYFMNYGSGLAFFVCLGCGILIWHDESSRSSATAVTESA